MFLRFFLLFLLAISLSACAAASSETKSTVSATDIPASRYQKLALFVEGLDDSERPAAEQIILGKLRENRLDATLGSDVFQRRGQLSERAKSRIIQTEFDGVMYVSVLDKRIVEELVPNADTDGQTIWLHSGTYFGVVNAFGTLGLPVNEATSKLYIVKGDGHVYKPELVLKTKVDIQDAKSAKLVWTAESSASGHPGSVNVAQLFTQVSDQIVERMREDHAI